MTLAIEEVLAVWRDAERVRDTLPPGDPWRAVIDAEISGLRGVYARMTELATRSHEHFGLSVDQVASATEALERVRARLDLAGGTNGSIDDAFDPLSSHLTVEPADG